MARLTKIRTASGDSGFSNLVSGLRIRKSNDICALQNQIQFLSNDLRTFVFCSGACKLVPQDHVLFLGYICSSYEEMWQSQKLYIYLF